MMSRSVGYKKELISLIALKTKNNNNNRKKKSFSDK